jgi:hypothetical protein
MLLSAAGSASADAVMVATGGVLEVVVENPSLPVAEDDFHQGETPHNGRILFLHHPSLTPLGILMVNDPVAYFQVQQPSFFHQCLIPDFQPPGKRKKSRPFSLCPYQVGKTKDVSSFHFFLTLP